MTNPQNLASWAGFVCLLLALWVMLYPEPYKLCMGIMLIAPLVTIAFMRFASGSLAIVGDDKPVTLLIVFALTTLPLAYRAYLDVHIFSKSKPLLYAALVAIVAELLLITVDKAFRKMWMLGTLFPAITFTYGIGFVLECDMLLDHSSPQRFVTRVLHRDIRWGTRYKSYSVTLAPWGGNAEPTSSLVTGTLYYSVHEGGNACVYMASGAFQIPWYKIGACSN